MTIAPNEPMTYDAANQWLAARVNVPTTLGSRELALSKDFPAHVKASSFFSAKVAEAHVLDALRESADKYARGELNLASARAEMKKKLRGLGKETFDPSDKADKNVRNLGSTARLNLILTQNARMAAAVGARQVSMDPDMVERWPYLRFIPSTSRNQREAHKQFYNLILPKNDPFWQTHTPPLDYGCKCSLEDCDEEEAKEAGGVSKAKVTTAPDGTQSAELDINGRAVAVEPNASGYVFDVEAAFKSCDMSLVKDPGVRRIVHDQMVEHCARVEAQTTLYAGITQKTQGAQKTQPERVGVRKPDVTAIGAALSAIADALKAKATLPALRVSLGTLLPAHAEALGIGPAEAEMFLVSPGTAKYGAKHWKQNHAKTLNAEKALSLFAATIWNSEAKLAEKLEGSKPRRLVFTDPAGSAITTLWRHGDGWELNVVDAWEVEGSEYVNVKEGKSTARSRSRTSSAE